MKKKNVGIIGNGKWAKIMIPKIKKFANIKFIANTKTGYKKFNLSKISWIFVLTNNASHYDIVKYFLNKKKKVFCEKPLTIHLKNTIKLFNFARRKKTNLYVNDVEFFKKKRYKIKSQNFILRKKKSQSSKDSLLHRFAYHDFYLLRKYINLEDLKVKKYQEQKNHLLIILLTDNKIFKFIYDINSKDKKHKINSVNMMLFKEDPIEKMIKYIFKNDNLDYRENFSNSLFAGKLISIVNNKYC